MFIPQGLSHGDVPLESGLRHILFIPVYDCKKEGPELEEVKVRQRRAALLVFGRMK